MNRTIVTTGVLLTILGWTATAEAGMICAAAYANNVAPNAGCEIGTTNNDSATQVNLDNMFGFDDWVFDAKDEDVNGVTTGPNTLNLILTGGTLSGTWSIAANAFSLYSDIMLVFKDGSDLPPVYVGYLLNSISGSYVTPFSNSNNGNPKDISHVSIYVRGTGIDVPEPGTLALLGIGLLGMGLSRRRRKA